MGTDQRLRAALTYAAQNIMVLPVYGTGADGVCTCGKRDCPSPGKHPRTAHGHLDATVDEKRIRDWWTRWPEANIAMSCGASGRVVVDVDDKDGRPGPDNWHAIRQELGAELEETTIVETPSGGFHVHYLAGGHRVASKNDLLAAGIDVKAEGGYVLLPPSAVGGIEYAYVDDHGPDRVRDLPERLAERLAYRRAQESTSGGSEPCPAGAEIAQGARNETLFRDACAMRNRGFGRSEIQAAIAEKNKRCSPPLSGEEVRHICASAVKYESNEGEAALEFARTDTGNAELFCALYGERLRYDHRRGAWFVFGKHHWAEDGDGAVYRLGVETARQRYCMALEIADLPAREVESKFAIASENRQRLEAMLALARRQIPITTAGDAWNRDALLLGVANGVVDLRDGRRRAGRPSELISFFSGVPFDATASCPRWERFLSEIFCGDDELIDWIWRLVGYLLSALTDEQCFFLCYGIGANGKSTFLNVLRALLGSYAYNAPFTTFEAASRGQIPNDLAALADRRLVTSAETGENTRLNEARLKMLTGSDPVTARFLHREFFTFTPLAKFVLAVNHKPKIRDYSQGFWRRVRLVPFEARFEGAADDKHLEEKLSAELPGILAWALRGHESGEPVGLNRRRPCARRPPPTAPTRTRWPLFSPSAALAEAGSLTKAATALAAYTKWADELALPETERLPRNRFYELLESHFPKRHTKAGNLYLGLRICDPTQPTFDETPKG